VRSQRCVECFRYRWKVTEKYARFVWCKQAQKVFNEPFAVVESKTLR